ncbi:ATP-binding protein [Janthinobacterium sp. SUN118]|uniref:ATP-binding protein n=1 Tax=Janthinobacterium sp. SUN118 TaxID=3004100 RepID=UPI0025B013F7|nr:ATP-binding protein [Janthinobacterium sp. SUN118]MDN2707972.1 ATP-binding protein [Janthinobacterium sp. SUN118]
MTSKDVFHGINPAARLENFTADEYKIVNNLSRHFYVTTGCKEIKIGKSQYRYFFLKFTTAKAMTYGLNDEIIVLFSPFENFEPRTLDAIEEIQEKNSGFRLDKICAFVISKDEKFIDKIDRTIKSHKESRIVTPFTYLELSIDRNDDFYRERIKKYFFERNLFDFDSPLRKDLYFFGRDNICLSIIDKHESLQNSSLFGLRRSGKTSILLSVCRRLAAKGGLFTLVDCQLLHLGRWWDALYFIADKASKDTRSKININRGNYTEFNSGMEFDKDITKIFHKNGKTILLILDEIEQITFDISFSAHWRSGEDYVKFWHVLRSVFQKPQPPITFSIAGTNPRCLETPIAHGGDNPLFGQIAPEYIEKFEVPQTKQMIETLSSYMGIKFEEDIYSYLTREFGGHPFLIRQACSYIKNMLDANSNRRVDRILYEEAAKNFNEGVGQGFCDMVVGVLAEHYPDEYTMLCYLARGDNEDFDQLALNDGNYVQHLVGYGVIYKATIGYDFQIDAIKKHLARKEKYQRLKLTNAEKLAEISERRNHVEHRLRKLVQQILRVLLGESAAIQQILAKHDVKSKRKYFSLSYKELFDPHKHEIYFDDLRELMRKNWNPSFQNVFSEDVEKFNSKMILLNSIGRSDAHRKNVPDSDMQIFRGTMTWLEENVNSYLD